MRTLAAFVLALLYLIGLAGCGITPLVPTHMEPVVATNLKAYTQTAQMKTKIIQSTRTTETPSPKPSKTPSVSRTFTATLSHTPTITPSPTDTPIPMPKLVLMIVTCDTGVDVFHGMGEVTNAYATLQNVGNLDATNVNVVLQASDENREHPDKQYLIQVLPPGYQITIKLTVDTQDGLASSIQVDASTNEGVSASATKQSCPARKPDQGLLDKVGELFKVQRINP